MLEEKDKKVIYNKALAINDSIMAKAEANEKLSFYDHYIFQCTSYMIAIINKELYMDDDLLMSHQFIYRCLIENLALLNMYAEGDIPKESEELLESYNYIIEYEIYKKYKELDGIQLPLDFIKARYDDAKKKYREILKDKTSSEFKKLIQSRLPFLFNEYSFREIVKNYCPDLLSYYDILSVIIHPNDIRISYNLVSKSNFKEINESVLEKAALFVFEHIDVNSLKIKKTFDSELKNAFRQKNKLIYREACKRQQYALYEIANIIDSNAAESTLTCTLREIADTIYSIGIDALFGFSEIIKVKFKHIAELLAVYDYIYGIELSAKNINLNLLFSYYTNIRLFKCYNFDNKVIDKLYNDGHKYYKSIYGNIDFDEFKKKINSALGFLPESTSINSLVYRLLDRSSNDKIVSTHMKLLYDEAQALSHANGYMISANSGAFMESGTIVKYIDSMISFTITFYKINWEIYLNDSHIENKAMVEEMGKQIDIFQKACFDKAKIEFVRK